jgi:hypothetical protein
MAKRRKASRKKTDYACLDFSVAKKGFLTAYRWSGDPELSPEHLVYVPAEV